MPETACKVNRYIDMHLEEGTDVLDLDEVEFWEDICHCPTCSPAIPEEVAIDPDFIEIAA